MSSTYSFVSLKPLDLHKHLLKRYYQVKDVDKLRDESEGKKDIDIIREHHKFIWNNSAQLDTWEEKLAKKYYDKLYKEYCVCDLRHYKENKIALRWQLELELISGKGQFICGEKKCPDTNGLRTWEVNFAYLEDGEKKNALVKLRLCNKCSFKLNYKKKRKEIKKLHKRRECLSTQSTDKSKHKNKWDLKQKNPEVNNEIAEKEVDVWKKNTLCEHTRDDDFENYLDMLLL